MTRWCSTRSAARAREMGARPDRSRLQRRRSRLVYPGAVEFCARAGAAGRAGKSSRCATRIAVTRYRIGNAVVHSLGWAQRRGPYSPRLWLTAIQAIQTRHREAAFDCLHAIWADEPGWIGAVCAQQLGLPLVVSLAGGELSRLPGIDYGLQRYRVQGRLIRWALARASLVTAGSRYMLDLARLHVPDPQRLVLAPLGVDSDRFSPRNRTASRSDGASKTEPESSIPLPETHLRNAPSKIINVGSLAAVKGHALLLRAMRHVAAELPEARLRIVGEGPLQSALRRQIAELGLTRQVTLDGAIGPRAAAGHIPDGRAIRANVAARSPGDGGAGGGGMWRAGGGDGGWGAARAGRARRRHHNQDDRALADAVLALLRDPVRRAGMAHAARAAVLDFYGVDACVTRFMDVYAACAARRVPS